MQTRGMGMVVEVFIDGFVRVRHWDPRSGEEQNVRLKSSQCQAVEVPDIVETTLKSVHRQPVPSEYLRFTMEATST